ncbi:MAG: DUF4332 domain-containing protein [Planctomyces sp.]|nr:DUF4332 domain-containing protein [Planctomyces sp.]
MQIVDIHLERFGTLSDVLLSNLSSRLTVFWGPNGCGKSTMVRFVRGMLFGLARTSPMNGHAVASESGSLKLRLQDAFRTLRRSRMPGGLESVSLTDESGQTTGHGQSLLPFWVTDEIFGSIFTVDGDSVDRMDSLVRLCRDLGQQPAQYDHELRCAEMALQQAILERDGSLNQPGIVLALTEQRTKADLLRNQLAGLRRITPELTTRIDQLTREIEELNSEIARIDIRVADLDRKIQQLERLLAELRRTSVISLSRSQIEAEIRSVESRLRMWSSVRLALNPLLTSASEDQHSIPSAEAALKSMRALVSRLENRVQEIHTNTNEMETENRVLRRHLVTEVSALCRYFGDHEQSVRQQTEAIERHFGLQCRSQAEQAEAALQSRLEQLSRELRRCENVLAGEHVNELPKACSHWVHQPAAGFAGNRTEQLQSVEQIEAEIVQLRRERTHLIATRGEHEETRHARRALLEKLQSELKTAATLEQIDQLRARIAECDAEVEMLAAKKSELDQTETSLRDLIARLRLRFQTRVYEIASGYIRRLTEGECTDILPQSAIPSQTAIADELQVRCSSPARTLTISQLSRGTRHQVALAMRLALIQLRNETAEHVPLILDDVFITSDDSRAEAAVQVLTEVAERGQQIVFFTCQKDVRDLFTRFGASVRVFGQRNEPVPLPAEVPVLRAFVDRVPQPVPPVVTELPPPPEPVAPPVVFDSQTSAEAISRTNWLFYLEVDHGVEDLAGLTLAEQDALRSAGILTIDDLLRHPLETIEERTRARGYLLSRDRIESLRGQSELTCRVPMLRRSDAALLYASGIRTVEELAQLRPEAVYDRIVAFQRTEAGARFRRAGRFIDRQQAINWARWGQHARSLHDARVSRSHFSVRRIAAPGTDSAEVGDVARQQRRERLRQVSTRARRRRPGLDEDAAAERRALRQARRRKLASRLRASSPPAPDSADSGDSEPVEAVATLAGTSLRFFLSRSSDVEAAPSIGPRTAESLHVLGIRTVDHLLNAAPDQLAAQMNQRRISATVIEQWQAQARLMCMVPELRGHDTQLLVACGIVQPDDLSRRVPAELLAIVGPFAESKEGERILRNARKPDLDEVTNWISWAQHARAFRAA